MRRWLAKRRKGALAMVALAGMVPVTAMMSANVNTSQMVDDRRQAQDAADALADLHGVWTARALNIISMNNVTTAQLMAVSVGSEALYMTTTELTLGALAANANIVAHGAQHCSVGSADPISLAWLAFCSAQHAAVSVPANLALARAADINSDFKPLHGIRTAERALEAIDGMNRALATRHARAMREIAEGYHELLEIEDHHFADPCQGTGPEACRQTNSRDGMALPLEPAEILDYTHLAFVAMERGTTSRDSTFQQRGFDRLDGPMRVGGTTTRPMLIEHINHITEIGDSLYEFRRFYQRRHSHMVRRPFTGPGTGATPSFPPPYEPPLGPRNFVDRSYDVADTARNILEIAVGPTEFGLQIGRIVPLLGFDRHPPRGYLFQQRQSRTNNSFHRNFRMLHGSVAMPDVRTVIPLGLDLLGGTGMVFANAVPEIWRLRDLDAADMASPPVDAAAMPDPYRILAFSLREPAERLGTTVFGAPDTDHTGYGQTGVFNPDGASLYSQNWMMRTMPATRLDDPSDASRELGREATAGFDDLAETLGHVGDRTSWRRVNAH